LTTARADSYVKTGDVSGGLTSVGSDTLANVMTKWTEEFAKLYPNVKPQVESKGSATVPSALAENRALLGPMSREMKPEEISLVESKRGFKPTRIDVAIDCLAVYVHKDNPVKGFTLAQLDAIFSKTDKRGLADIVTWGQVGATDAAWAEQPISIYGRDSNSGTALFFKEHVLLKGDFKPTVKEQPGSAGVVNGIASDRQGIGYSGIGYKTSDVRTVPLAKGEKSKFVAPNFENAIDKSYPLGRVLYIYVAQKPGEPMSPLVKEFLLYVLSKEGQAIVEAEGYGQLPEKLVAKNVKLLE
jgi:phosphate transport system substrate-binding protein